MSRVQLATFTPFRLDPCSRRVTPAYVPNAAGWRCSCPSTWSCLTTDAAMAIPKSAAHCPEPCIACCIC